MFEYTLARPAPWAVELPASAVTTSTSFSECLFVAVTVEHGDTGLEPVAAELIQRIAEESAANSIVIGGRFCPATPDGDHSADFLSELADALDLLAEITELSASAAPTCLMPFGWHSRTRGVVVAGNQARRLIHLWPNGVRESSDAPPEVIVLIDLPTGIETFSAEPQEAPLNWSFAIDNCDDYAESGSRRIRR
ncbi:hypothetical protein [Nocardia sp. NPDC046763]|uniref:hypothetical protein n=1 Tax=Nocardia sp. NPDC046763 TaxID=3155256 RepID=UPI00340BB9D2